MISAYTIAMGAEQRRFPWRAAIQSALSIADEFVLVYDPRFDNPDVLKVDDRVKLIQCNIGFLEWDFINNMLTAARKRASGDWLLQTELDIVFDESANTAIDDKLFDLADDLGSEGIHIPVRSPIQNLLKPSQSTRQMLTRNVPYIYHKTSPYMIKQIDSDIWDGKCIKSYDYDDWSLYDERTDRWFSDKTGIFADTLAWHYAFYNPGRKNAQGRQVKEWQDRTYGRSTAMNVDALVKSLKETIVINPEETKQSYEWFKNNGYVEVNLVHPYWAQDWVLSMGLDAI